MIRAQIGLLFFVRHIFFEQSSHCKPTLIHGMLFITLVLSACQTYFILFTYLKKKNWFLGPLTSENMIAIVPKSKRPKTTRSHLCHSHDALTAVSWQSSFQMFQGEKAVASTFVCLFHTVSSSSSKVLVLFFYLIHNDCDKWHDCDCQAHVLLCLSLACVQFTWSFQCKHVGWLLYKPLWPLWLFGSFLCKLAISYLIVAMCITRI